MASFRKESTVVTALILLLLVAIVFGLGLAAKALLWIAFILLALWIIGWLFHPTGRRWYYW